MNPTFQTTTKYVCNMRVLPTFGPMECHSVSSKTENPMSTVAVKDARRDGGGSSDKVSTTNVTHLGTVHKLRLIYKSYSRASSCLSDNIF